jgi:hypothetical protein
MRKGGDQKYRPNDEAVYTFFAGGVLYGHLLTTAVAPMQPLAQKRKADS